MSTGWPPGSPRVLVTDGWLANAGDGAVALAVDQVLRALAPGASILYAAYQGDLLHDRYPELHLVPPLATLLQVPGASGLPLEWRGGPAPKLVEDADLVLSQGGGFLLEHYHPWERLFALAKVVELGKPLVLLGQTIGEFRFRRARALLESIVRGAHAIAVRERASFDRMLALGADPARVALTGDLAWLFADTHIDVAATKKGVGVVLTTHEQSPVDVDRQAIANAVLTEVVERAGGDPITLMSTVQGMGSEFEDDSTVAREALAALPKAQQSSVSLVDSYLTPRDAMALVGGFRAVVSQRLHPVLFALSQGVPAALLLMGDKAAVLDEPPVRPLVCLAPDDVERRSQVIESALDPGAARGDALRDVVRPVIERAQGNAEVLRRALADQA